MRASLEFVIEAPELEPSENLTASILLSSQAERRTSKTRSRRRRVAISLVKTFGCAAGLLLASAIYFQSVLTATPNTALPQTATSAKTGPSLDTITQTTADLQTLAAAVAGHPNTPRTPWENERIRAVCRLNTDISAALAALERNPGCTRATHVVTANVQRQAEALRALYFERSF